MGCLAAKQGLRLLLGRCSRDDAYALVRHEVNKRLQEKYAGVLAKSKTEYDSKVFTQERSKKVWVCWLQGFEKAPEIVKVCQQSLKRHLTDREIIQLTYENYTDYVTLPEYIVKKYEKKQIPPALFADLLRLEVLIRYGGTWMDASILCTGFTKPNVQKAKKCLDANLFMFQALRKGDKTFYGTSNWFITACTNSRPLMVLRDVLCQYWNDYSVTLNYYMFHDFFYAIAQLFPEEIAAMPRKNRLFPLMLMERMKEPYDEKWWKELTDHVCFHKLCWRVSEDVKSNEGNFYNSILNGNQLT